MDLASSTSMTIDKTICTADFLCKVLTITKAQRKCTVGNDGKMFYYQNSFGDVLPGSHGCYFSVYLRSRMSSSYLWHKYLSAHWCHDSFTSVMIISFVVLLESFMFTSKLVKHVLRFFVWAFMLSCCEKLTCIAYKLIFISF